MSDAFPEKESTRPQRRKFSLHLPDVFELHLGPIDPSSHESHSTVDTNLSEHIERQFREEQGLDQLLMEYDLEYLSDDDDDDDRGHHSGGAEDDANTIDTAQISEGSSLSLIFDALKEDMRRVSKPRCPRRMILSKRRSFGGAKGVQQQNDNNGENPTPVVAEAASELNRLDLEGIRDADAAAGAGAASGSAGASFNRDDIERRECRRRASKAADLAMLRSNNNGTQDVLLGPGKRTSNKRMSFSAVELRRYKNAPVSKRPSLLKKGQLTVAGFKEHDADDDEEAPVLLLVVARPTIEKIEEDLGGETTPDDSSGSEDEK